MSLVWVLTASVPCRLTDCLRSLRYVWEIEWGGRVARSRVVFGDLRVQVLERAGSGRSYAIVCPACTVDAEADSYLRLFEGSGSQKTYA